MNPLDLPQQAGALAASVAADSPVAAADDAAYRAKAGMAAEKFEAFFIAQMLRQMRSATRAMASEDSVFKDRVAADMLDLGDTMVADKMAGLHAFGIADAILKQLLPKQTSSI